MTGLSARAWGGDNVFEWVAVLEDVSSDFWAKTTVVREGMDWEFHFPRDVVQCEKRAE